MIWLRRLLLIPVGLAFFLSLLLALIVLELNASFLRPSFYTSALNEHDVYEFVLVDLLATALEDMRAVEEAASRDGEEDLLLLTSGLATEEIVSSVNRAIPPSWVQEEVEQAFDEFGSYILGLSDEFTVTLSGYERVDSVVAEIKTLATREDVYNSLYDRVLVPRIEDASEDIARQELPFHIRVSSERLVAAARAVVPPEWVRSQLESILDEVTPYLKGESDTFTITVRLAERADVAAAEVKAILAERDVYDLVYDEVVAPRVAERLGDWTRGLPFAVAVSSDEVVAALRQSAPPAWARHHAERLIDDATPYFAGQADSFETQVSLVDNKRQTLMVLTDLTERKIQEGLDDVPDCRTIEQAGAALAGGPSSLPSCIPPAIERTDLPARLGVDVGAAVELLVLAPIPDTVTFSDVRFRSAMAAEGGSGTLSMLDDIRAVLRDGWTYTQDDLREDLTEKGDESVFETFQGLRSFLSDGWTYTHVDFVENLEEEDGAVAIEDINRVRGIFKTFRAYDWSVHLSTMILLVGMGFLGGRGWLGRVKWGASSLLVSAGIVLILFVPVYRTEAPKELDGAREQALLAIDPAGEYAETLRLAANKGFNVAESALDSFAAGVALLSLLLVIVAAIVLAAAVQWPRLAALLRRAGQGLSSE